MGRKEINKSQQNGYHTSASLLLSLITAGVMAYLGAKYIGSDRLVERQWAMFAFLHMTYALVGGVVAPMLFTGSIKPTARLDPMTFLKAGVIFISIIFYQKFIFSLSITGTDRMFYHIFSAVSEETFYRGFLINAIERVLIQKLGKIAVWIGVVLSGLLFAAGHVSYWGDPVKMLIVLGAGLILGMFYVIWRDLTANIAGHLFNNLISSGVFVPA